MTMYQELTDMQILLYTAYQLAEDRLWAQEPGLVSELAVRCGIDTKHISDECRCAKIEDTRWNNATLAKST